MICRWPPVYVLVLSQTLTKATLLPLTNMTEVIRWELLASTILRRFAHFTYDVQVVCKDSCSSDEFLQRLLVPIQLTKPRLHDDSLLFILTQ